MRHLRRILRTGRIAPALILALLVTASAALADDARGRGYVDCEPFLELAGEDTSMTRVKLHGSLLRLISKVDPDLADLVGGLESIHAVILELETERDVLAARKIIRDAERRLEGRGWEALAVVRERGTEVRVMVLNDEDVIEGLMVMSLDEGEVVCANIAGILDLAKIAALGEEFDIPGLDDIPRGEGDHREKRGKEK